MLSVLTVNAGSSSLKLRLIDPTDQLVAEEELPVVRGHAVPADVVSALERLGPADAVGHRIVEAGCGSPAPCASTRTSSRR